MPFANSTSPSRPEPGTNGSSWRDSRSKSSRAAAGLESLGELALAMNAYGTLNGGIHFCGEILAAAQRLDTTEPWVDTWPLYWGLLQNELAPAAAKIAAAEVLRRRPWPISPQMVTAGEKGWPSFAAARMLEETRPIPEVWMRYAGSQDLDLALAVADRLQTGRFESQAGAVYRRAVGSSRPPMSSPPSVGCAVLILQRARAPWSGWRPTPTCRSLSRRCNCSIPGILMTPRC